MAKKGETKHTSAHYNASLIHTCLKRINVKRDISGSVIILLDVETVPAVLYFLSFYYAKLNHNVLLLITKLLYKFDKAIYKTFILINRCVLGNPCVIVVINMFFFYDVCMLKKKTIKSWYPVFIDILLT